eukprot:scaffold13381_cov124-Amphora_coffeaeformis.AAC.1
MIVAILQRISCSPVVTPKVVAASARLGPALGTTLARYMKKTYSTGTANYNPYTNDHSFDVFDGVTKHYDALKNKKPEEKPAPKIDTGAFVEAGEDAFDQNETLTKASRLFELVGKKPKKPEPTHIKTKAATKSSSTTVHTEELLATNPFDENEAYEKAARAAEQGKPFVPPREKFDKDAYVVENAFDVNETFTKTSRAQEKSH